MRIVSTYSHKDGEAFIMEHHKAEFDDVASAIVATDAVQCLKKISKERTKPPLLFHPESMNSYIKTHLCPRGWTRRAPNSKKGFREPRINLGNSAFREMDGIKNKVGLEIQFGKYAFMGYDIFSKMPIFAKRGLIECGIEVVVVASVIKEMSTGVSSFTQIVMDMQERGAADLDIPTLVVGIGLTPEEELNCQQKRARFLTQRDAMIASGEVSPGRKGASPGPKGSDFLFEDEDEDESEEA